MKKIVVYSILTLTAVTLVGCGSNSTDSAVKDLNAQLAYVGDSISSVNSQDMSSLGLSTNFSQNGSTNYASSYNLFSAKSKVANDLNMQSQLTSQINDKISSIKETLKNNKTKFNKNQVKAIKKLSGQLNTYAGKVKNSKDEMKNDLKTINYNQNINHMSFDQLSAGYNGVSNVLETRKACYYNLLNTLSQIQGIVGTLDNSCNDCNNTNNPDNCKNISNNDNTKTEEKENESEQNQPRRNINIPDNFNAYNNLPPKVIDNTYGNYQNPYFNGYGYNYAPNNYYGYNGFYNNPYYGGVYNNGYAFNNGVVNPSRNTDSYRPNRVNIDTYRFNPNNGIRPASINSDEAKNIEDDNDGKEAKPLDDESLEFKPDTEKLYNQNKNMTKIKHNTIKKVLNAKKQSFDFDDNSEDPRYQITRSDDNKYKRLNEDEKKDTTYSKPIKSNHHVA